MVNVSSILTMSTNQYKYNNMKWTLDTHYSKDTRSHLGNIAQMLDELTRADVLGIIETHKFNII